MAREVATRNGARLVRCRAASDGVVDVTTAALQVSALLLPPDSGVRTAAALPLALLLALPVVVWLAHRSVRCDLRTALSTLSLAVGATLATGVAFGRWF